MLESAIGITLLCADFPSGIFGRTLAAAACAHKAGGAAGIHRESLPAAESSRLGLALGRGRARPGGRRRGAGGRQRFLGRGVLGVLLAGAQLADVLLVLIVAVGEGMAAAAVGHEIELL